MQSTKTNSHGLTERQLKLIDEMLLPFLPKITEVKLFGSRATGHYKSCSDIDMVLFGADLTAKDEARIFTLFNDSMLSLKVDVVVYDLIHHSKLKKHIDAVAVTI